MNNVCKIFRYLIYTLEIYMLYSLQQASIFSFSCLGIAPVLVIAGFICISHFENEFTSMAFGILSGFLIDLSFGSVLGANAFILGIMGYILGILFSYYIKANFLSAMFFSSIASLAMTFVNFYIHQFIEGFLFMGLAGESHWNLIGMCAGLASLPVYLFNRSISYLTREKRNETKQS